MKSKIFPGEKKSDLSIFTGKIEKKIIEKYVKSFPSCIKSYHLTLMTLLWSAGVILSGYFAQYNINFLWLASVLIVLQWFTDSFDGSLGKHRKEGIPKWAFYMDHFLDYIFICSMFVSYSFIIANTIYFSYLFLVVSCFMAHSFLQVTATNKFKIVNFGISPTDIRILLILANTFIIKFGTDSLEKFVPHFTLILLLFLCITVYSTQKRIWKFEKAHNIDKQ
ncbi:hypothetical protein ACFL1B_04040 [Nanoarchaeota archaeon]